MHTTITLDDVAFEAWRQDLDNLAQVATGDSIYDMDISDEELREHFDADEPPATVYATLRSEGSL